MSNEALPSVMMASLPTCASVSFSTMFTTSTPLTELAPPELPEAPSTTPMTSFDAVTLRLSPYRRTPSSMLALTSFSKT